MRLVYRPIGTWTDPVTSARKTPTFRSTWSSTKELLLDEVRMIQRASDSDDVVVQIDVPEEEFRLDGDLRKHAKVRSPRVVVSFEAKGQPLRFACDRYDGWYNRPGWEQNVRAIALTLQALRAVDRYGAAQRGEQYTGWAQLGSGTPMPAAPMTADEAVRILRTWWNGATSEASDWTTLYRRGAKVLHPDAGGSADDFQRLQAAYELLRGGS